LNGLRATASPKPKFFFKREQATVLNPNKSVRNKPTSSISELPPSKPLISSHRHAYLTVASLIGSPRTSSLTISDLDYCILNFLSTSVTSEFEISAIHLNKVSNSVLLLPLTNCSILAHDLSRCVVVVGCHQVQSPASANSREKIHKHSLVSYAHIKQGGCLSLHNIKSDRGGLS